MGKKDMVKDPATGEIIDLEVLIKAELDKAGHELVNPVPMAPPLGYKKSPDLADQIRDMVRSEHLRQAAENAGMESFDEANDFEVEDSEPYSEYELQELEGETHTQTDLLNQMQGYADQLGYDLVRRQPPKPSDASSGAQPPQEAGKSAGKAPESPPVDKAPAAG